MTDGVKRRGFLALAAAVPMAGCSTLNTIAPNDEEPAEPTVSVEPAYWSAQKLSKDDFKPIPGDFVYQVAVGLSDPSPEIEKVEFTVFADYGPVTTSWKLPEQKDESRNLGENIYGETVHNGEGTFERGDPWEARVYTADSQKKVDEGEIPENTHESE